MTNKLPKLSVVIPAHNEEGGISDTLWQLYRELDYQKIPHELLVINDNSNDGTEALLKALKTQIPTLDYFNNEPPNGFGFAVRCGLRQFQGDCVAVFMADASDAPSDLTHFYRVMVRDKLDCVFGTRWSNGGKVFDYPFVKLLLNRMANLFIKVLFQFKYNDTTNAFKLYRRHVIEGLEPLLSYHFNLTVELPLKAIVRGYSYTVLPNSWTNRKAGVSKLKIKEMGSRYLFIVIYCLIEKWLSRGDYRKPNAPNATNEMLNPEAQSRVVKV